MFDGVSRVCGHNSGTGSGRPDLNSLNSGSLFGVLTSARVLRTPLGG